MTPTALPDAAARQVTLGDLKHQCGAPLIVEPSCLLSRVVAAFTADPSLAGAVVQRGTDFVCLLSPKALSQQLARGYFRDLFLHRPLSKMLQTWHPVSMELATEITVTQALARAMARPAEHRYEPFVATDPQGGRFVVDLVVLLSEQVMVFEQAMLDLAERNRAILESERQRELLHAKLMDASRQAGMAEVATTVLHNVGNVLNSVNVSASVIERRLQESKLPGLSKAVELLDQHRGELASFLQNDQRGRQLPDYLAKLASLLGQEHTELSSEIDALQRSLEHIQSVVTAQQEHARGALVCVPVRLDEVVEEALRLNSIALERHGITIVRDFGPGPTFDADKHKLLQILVNLVSNAKKAMRQNGDRPKLLTVRTRVERRDEQDTAVVEVIDNGIGIEQDHLRKMFSHGFTTWSDGHGFGLHGAANDAKLMSGSLTVHSDGPELGACFRLSLPLVHTQEQAHAA